MNRKTLLVACLLFSLTLGLAGCGTVLQTAPAPLPTVVLDGNTPAAGTPAANTPAAAAGATETEGNPSGLVGDGPTASGVLAPAAETEMVFSLGERVLGVDVNPGDQVQAGQVLVRLAGGEKYAAAVAAAELDLLAARQELDTLNENAAQGRAQALLRLANAKDAFDDAEKRRGWAQYRVGDDNQINVARADLIVAEDTLKRTEDAFGGYEDTPEDNLNKAAALSALSAARKAREKALANLNYLLSLPDAIEVEKADAALEVARTELDSAQRAADRLQNGPDPAELALAQARVENAAAQLAASQAALADLDLKAPFAGVVSKIAIHSGEWAVAGQPVLVLADLSEMRVETTDLSERDVPRVALGQPASVYIKALDQTVIARVIEIAPLADELGGDVVYRTVLKLDSQPAGLRAGMSVDVRFIVE